MTTSTEDPLALERQVCFALSIASGSVLGLYRPLLEPMGFTQYLVMLPLWGEAPLSVKRIGELLRLDAATLSPLFKRSVISPAAATSPTHDNWWSS